MKKFYSSGGRSNPDFRYKVQVKKPFNGMMEWCDNYPTGDHGYFKRYYIDWRDKNGDFDNNYATFQFEWEEAAIMFKLKFFHG